MGVPMNYCDCDCSHELARLQDQIRTLEHQLDSLRRDLEGEISDRRDAVHMLANDINDVSMAR